MALIAEAPPDSTKMKELILHVAVASANDPKCGAVKFNKILFYADFLAHFKRGRSITKLPYFAIQDGPAPQQFVPIREEMEQAKDIAVQKLDVGYGNPQTRIVALRSPDYTKLESEEVAMVDWVIAKLRGLTGREVSDLSHKFKGWEVAFAKGPKTIINYSSVFLDPTGFWDVEVPQLPDDQVDYGKALWAKIAAA